MDIIPVSIISGISYFGLTILIVYFGLKAVFINTTDSRVIYENKGNKLCLEPEVDENLKYYCDICQSFIHERTKHGRDCNKCCEEFDHHGIWLNNCVGKKNYRVFIILVILFTLQTSISLLSSFLLIFITLIDSHYSDKGFQIVYGTTMPSVIVIPGVIVSIIFNFSIITFTATLLKFHYMLYKGGISTYEYIIYSKEKERRKKSFKDGVITKEIYEEENERAFEDIHISKKSKDQKKIKMEYTHHPNFEEMKVESGSERYNIKDEENNHIKFAGSATFENRGMRNEGIDNGNTRISQGRDLEGGN